MNDDSDMIDDVLASIPDHFFECVNTEKRI